MHCFANFFSEVLPQMLNVVQICTQLKHETKLLILFTIKKYKNNVHLSLT